LQLRARNARVCGVPTCDYLIIGGGVVGLSIARELKLRHPAAKITLIEKEESLGAHASGRNSGVIHSGIYYTAESLKAKLTKEGNAALVAYCAEKSIPVRRCGKLIVARSKAEHPMLDELLHRGGANGVEVQDLSEEETRKIEPRTKTAGRALFVPSTASVDPRLVVAALEEECRAMGVEIALSTKYVGLASCGGRGRREAAGKGAPSSAPAGSKTTVAPSPQPSPAGSGRSVEVRTSAGAFSAGFVVNCAGLYADKIARDFSFSKRYRILPFKGLYLESPEPPGSLRCHVYPVPSKTNPFLGVHATVKTDGGWKIGPTAIPALWRENYSGFAGFDAAELAEVAIRQLGLLFGSNFDFRRLAWEEIRKQSQRRILALAGELLDLPLPAGDLSRRSPEANAEGRGEGDQSPLPTWQGGEREEFQGQRRWDWGTPGIRAQLVDIETKRLVDDFVIEGDNRSLHVLNAVSPAFTCCLTFARLTVDKLDASGEHGAPSSPTR